MNKAAFHVDALQIRLCSIFRKAKEASFLVLLIVLIGFGGTASAQQATRSFQLGFTPLPPVYSQFGFDVAYTYLQRESDLVSHTLQYGVPWPEALKSSDWRTYPDNLKKAWEQLLAADEFFIPNHFRYISIHPINYQYDGLAEYWGEQSLQPLPSPWNTYNFDDPNVKQAFLNYAIATVEFFHPTYLGLGVEVNILLARTPWLWGAYKALNAYVYQELKKRYPDLIVFTTVQYEHMLGQQYDSKHLLEQVGSWYPTVLVDEVDELMKASDLLALSSYPFMAYGATEQASHYDTALQVSQQTGRRIAIEQTGYTSESVNIYYSTLTGTETLQTQFMANLLDLAYTKNFAFIVNFIPIDYATNYGTDPVSMTWAYTGLWRPDGSSKMAVDVWRAYFALPLDSK